MWYRVGVSDMGLGCQGGGQANSGVSQGGKVSWVRGNRVVSGQCGIRVPSWCGFRVPKWCGIRVPWRCRFMVTG